MAQQKEAWLYSYKKGLIIGAKSVINLARLKMTKGDQETYKVPLKICILIQMMGKEMMKNTEVVWAWDQIRNSKTFDKAII